MDDKERNDEIKIEDLTSRLTKLVPHMDVLEFIPISLATTEDGVTLLATT